MPNESNPPPYKKQSTSKPSTWTALWSSLDRRISTAAAAQRFQLLRDEHPALARFPEPRALVAHLARRDIDLDEADRIYAVLVREAQRGGERAELATALVWIGLRPALDQLYRRRLRPFVAPDEAASEIAVAFTSVVHRADLRRIRRVASTLVSNANRDINCALRHSAKCIEMATDVGDSAVDPVHAVPSTRLFLAGPRASADHELHALREHLRLRLGRNADIVLGAAVLEASHREMAERLGISYEGIRKRYQLAIAKLRRELHGEESTRQCLPIRRSRARVAR